MERNKRTNRRYAEHLLVLLKMWNLSPQCSALLWIYIFLISLEKLLALT